MTEAAALLEELGLLRARGCNSSVTGPFGGRSCLVAVAACWQHLLKGYGWSVFVTHLSLCLSAVMAAAAQRLLDGPACLSSVAA